jgi:hypothetical protein
LPQSQVTLVYDPAETANDSVVPDVLKGTRGPS